MWRLLSNVVTWLVKCEGESNKNQQNHSLPVLKSNPETLVSKLGFLGSLCFLGRKHTPLKSIMKRQKLCENYWSFPTIKGAVFIFLPFFFFLCIILKCLENIYPRFLNSMLLCQMWSIVKQVGEIWQKGFFWYTCIIFQLYACIRPWQQATDFMHYCLL